VKLARAPGARESRWAQLLCGDAGLTPAPPGEVHEDQVSAGELSALKAEQTRMAAELASLKALVQRMARELGIAEQPE
jgi:uncharacterized protein YceH (UPF0502 family)